MKASWKIATVRGIEIKVHVTFWVLPFILAFAFASVRGGFDPQAAVAGFVFSFALFFCVVLHELGHSLTALRLGGKVRDIVLLPLGGVARIEKMPSGPAYEIVMAVAGPLVNIAIFFLLAAVMLVGGKIFHWEIRFDYLANPGLLIHPKYFLLHLAVANLFLAAFNMIPAFPMDGGRVTRGVLSLVLPYYRATLIAVRAGQFVFVIFIIFGVTYQQWLLMAIGLIMFFAAPSELAHARMRQTLTGIRARDLLASNLIILAPETPVGRVLGTLFSGFQEDFPVMSEGRVAGILTRTAAAKTLVSSAGNTPVKDVMSTEVPRINADTEIIDVYQQMASTRMPMLPVYDGATLLGFTTITHIARYMDYYSRSPR